MAGNVRFAGLGVVGVFTDVLDDIAESIFILADELGVFFLFVEKDARFVLFASELALQVGDTSPLDQQS